MMENPKILRLFKPMLICNFTDRHVNRWEIETVFHLGDGVTRITHTFRERKIVND
jgi:hypothetical protein